MIRRRPRSTLFPYPAVFRSPVLQVCVTAVADGTTYALQQFVGAEPIFAQIRNAVAEQGRMIDEQDEADHAKVAVDRKSTRLNSSHANISYAVFCLKKYTPISSSLFLTTSSLSARSTSPRGCPCARLHSLLLTSSDLLYCFITLPVSTRRSPPSPAL